MDLKDMTAAIRLAKPGDELEIIFADKTFKGDLKGRLYFILCMDGRTIRLGDLQMLTLTAVADSGRWEGFRTYTIEILAGFDAEYFISRTIGRELLESVKIAA